MSNNDEFMLAKLKLEIEDANIQKLLCYPKNIIESLLYIEFKLFGKNLPATFHHPAEFVELDDIKIEAVICYDEDNSEFNITSNQIRKIEDEFDPTEIEMACWEEYEDYLKNNWEN